MDEDLKRRLLGSKIEINWRRLLSMGLGGIFLVLFALMIGFPYVWSSVGGESFSSHEKLREHLLSLHIDKINFYKKY
ncbi:MAG: hypothetical protein V5A64_00580 [Candidatus Thermoplasmatota archaeon]